MLVGLVGFGLLLLLSAIAQSALSRLRGGDGASRPATRSSTDAWRPAPTVPSRYAPRRDPDDGAGRGSPRWYQSAPAPLQLSTADRMRAAQHNLGQGYYDAAVLAAGKELETVLKGRLGAPGIPLGEAGERAQCERWWKLRDVVQHGAYRPSEAEARALVLGFARIIAKVG